MLLSWEFFYKYRFYIVSLAISVIILGFVFGLSLYYGGKANDVRLLSGLKAYSYGLEAYYGQHRSYPVATDKKLAGVMVISDSGFGNPSGKVYYYARLDSGGTYTSDGSSYTISFRLSHRWSGQGLEGKKCQIRPMYKLQCT